MDCIIDTSILVDYILIDSEFHKRAEAGLEKISIGFLPTVVIEEMVYVLHRLKLSKRLIGEKVEEVLSSYEILSLKTGNMLEANKMIITENNTTFKRFNDKLILSAAKDRGIPLFTFDQNLARECRENGVGIIL